VLGRSKKIICDEVGSDFDRIIRYISLDTILVISNIHLFN